MYWLYAEDTKTGDRHPIAQLNSVRFSRAMRQAEKIEKSRNGARYFVCKQIYESGTMKLIPDMATAAYLGVRRKPAPVGSPENQEHQRRTLRKGKPSVRSGKVDWDSKNDAGETLNDVVVDIIRRRAEEGKV